MDPEWNELLIHQLNDTGIAKRGWSVSTTGLRDALVRFTDTARLFGAARDSARDADAARIDGANVALMQVERRLTRPQGLASRPWYMSLQFASDVDNGYSTMAFPSVNEAIRYADAKAVERELAEMVIRVNSARSALADAIAALR